MKKRTLRSQAIALRSKTNYCQLESAGRASPGGWWRHLAARSPYLTGLVLWLHRRLSR